ncbi:MAG: tRNA (guanosine(37)-N1)-methyltransferase TrmD [Pseudomonadales bacterium]|nr:tRNA (guanosine(37)-N1)-methyltransferase TrmD [Pseudomonadales bacterium]
MWLGIVTLFPEMFQAVSQYGITGRAVTRGLLDLQLWNPRDFTTDKHQTVDDKPYGGGPGMLMKVAPLQQAIEAARSSAPHHCKVIYLSPQGKRLDQQVLEQLAAEHALIFVAGRYEGIDERLISAEVDEEYSIGDYVLSGGELPAMVLIDGITRLIPGAVGDAESVANDSFQEGLLDFPQYTRPEEVNGIKVPEVLLSGHHQAIERWRLKQALGRTLERRPDLLEARQLSEIEQQLLAEYLQEQATETGKGD